MERDIRSSLSRTEINVYKLISDQNPDKIKALGRKLMRLTNTKLKMILLRSIHGDIYSGTRLKKFGMTDCDKCPRCDRPETIEHQLLSCYYCRTLWSAVSDLTGIRTSNMDSLLGLDDTHDTVTITIHSEIIRKLLAIERPTCNPIELLRSTLNNLALLEKGVTRYQINILQRQLDITYTQGLTWGEVASTYSFSEHSEHLSDSSCEATSMGRALAVFAVQCGAVLVGVGTFVASATEASALLFRGLRFLTFW